MHVRIDGYGRVITARVAVSSGYGDLDRAALALARGYRFTSGSSVREARIPVVFRLAPGRRSL